MKHKHGEIIKAWLDGEECEFWSQSFDEWQPITSLCPFLIEVKVRIKPKTKSDWCKFVFVEAVGEHICSWTTVNFTDANLQLIFDGKTNELKDSKVLK